jgi:hypothetical protein
VARFDLDRVGSTQFGAAHYGLVTQLIEGFEITLNEEALSSFSRTSAPLASAEKTTP